MSVAFTHEHYIKKRRVRVLSHYLSGILPDEASVLDVGTGDGTIARAIMDLKPGISILGVDSLVRGKTAIEVTGFDGIHLPFEPNSFDFTMFVDVLHHTHDPMRLLRESVRVARKGILIKDHCIKGFASEATLAFMDRVGNTRFGVSIPHNYWTEKQWRFAFNELQLTNEFWATSLNLYPWWADWLFGRLLHFVAKLAK